ncbi:MAG TPA: NUDIX domain-containing protein, partial [Polyangiaceae bacterium]|nr:NUDIX domain-containing protein [Polyangiaceae bacterium]
TWQTSGGVVLDPDTGYVLLVKNRRERREGFNGWTWPKGLIDPGEGPIFAALREIVEEAGVQAEPIGRIAIIETKRALRHYFLLSKIRDGLEHHAETVRVRWSPIDEAKRVLERKRDRRVLKAAQRMIRQLEEDGLPWLMAG